MIPSVSPSGESVLLAGKKDESHRLSLHVQYTCQIYRELVEGS